MPKSQIVLWIAGGIVLVLIWIIATQLSSEAKLRRRRKKTHSPVTAKKARPMVAFFVRTPKK